MGKLFVQAAHGNFSLHISLFVELLGLQIRLLIDEIDKKKITIRLALQSLVRLTAQISWAVHPARIVDLVFGAMREPVVDGLQSSVPRLTICILTGTQRFND